MQLTHTGNNGLTGFFVAGNAERRIFLCQARQSHTHFFLIGLRLGLDRLGNDRLGEHHAFEQNVGIEVAQGFTRCNVFQTNDRGDVACQHFLELFAVVGMHLQNTANTLFLALDRVVDRIA